MRLEKLVVSAVVGALLVTSWVPASTATAAVGTTAPLGATSVTRTFGYSVQHRPLVVTRIGDVHAPRRVLVVGCVHGNECAARAVVKKLSYTTAPAGTVYYLVPTLNPDGAIAHTRQNARGVDLNKNFPSHWHPNGHRWSPYYSGPKPLSEPESRAMLALLKQLKPTFSVWYHQHMDVVDFCGGSTAMARAYANATGMRLTRLPRYRGSVATWEHLVWPHASILTIELPAHVSAGAVRHHAAAVPIAALVAPGVPGVSTPLKVVTTGSGYAVSWRGFPGSGTSVDSYEIAAQVRLSSGEWSTWLTVRRAATARSHSVLVDPGATHRARVRAHSAIGWGEWVSSPTVDLPVAPAASR